MSDEQGVGDMFSCTFFASATLAKPTLTPMFTICCTTCDAKLVVKNDELIGQILACPKCGGMVLVEKPVEEEAVLDLALESEASLPTKRFPDAMGFETDSGVINPVEKPIVPPPPPERISEPELQTRKILLGVLAWLLLFLVFAIGLLIALKGDSNSTASTEFGGIVAEPPARPEASVQKTPEPSEEPVSPPAEQPAAAPPATGISVPDSPQDKPVEPKPAEPASQPEPAPPAVSSEDEAKAKLAELLAKSPEQTPSLEAAKPAEIRSTTDLLSDLQKKLPGLVEPSAALSIDIPARLRLPVVGMKLEKTPLLSAIRMISTMTEIPITLDIDEFRCRGIRVDEPVTETLEAGTVGDLLTKILAPFQLEPVIEDRQLLLTVSPERRNKIMERAFDVSDLVAGTKNAVDLRGGPAPDGNLTPQRLAEMLRRLVDPIGFAEATGDDRPSIHIEGDSLVVRQRLRMLDESLRLLEQLRVIRGLPQKTEVVGENLVPEVFGWDAVEQSMTLNYYQSTPLSVILDRVEAATKLRILIDHRALNRALAPLSSIRATVRSDRGTVNEALEHLLASVDTVRLAYRIVGYDLLEMTTFDAARRPDEMSVEVHRFETPERLLSKDETPEELVRTIRSVLEPNSWSEPEDMDSPGRGDLLIDRPSGCLIIRQSQPIQRQLRLWLGAKIGGTVPRPAPTE